MDKVEKSVFVNLPHPHPMQQPGGKASPRVTEPQMRPKEQGRPVWLVGEVLHTLGGFTNIELFESREDATARAINRAVSVQTMDTETLVSPKETVEQVVRVYYVKGGGRTNPISKLPPTRWLEEWFQTTFYRTQPLVYADIVGILETMESGNVPVPDNERQARRRLLVKVWKRYSKVETGL